MSLHPTAGVRVLLEIEPSQPAAGARYRGAILTPSERFDFEVTIAADATVQLAPLGEGAPTDRARDLLRSISRTIARHAIASDPPSWPRRVLRWRKVD